MLIYSYMHILNMHLDTNMFLGNVLHSIRGEVNLSGWIYRLDANFCREINEVINFTNTSYNLIADNTLMPVKQVTYYE